MQGYRTVAVGAVLAAGVPLLQYLSGLDWTKYVSPVYAPVISGLLLIGMRMLTTTPVGKKP